MSELVLENEKELPKGWTLTKLEDVSQIILGQSPPSSSYNKNRNGLPFYQGKLDFGSTYPTPRIWCIFPQKLAEKRDVLISVRAPVGPTNICQERSCIGRGLAAIRGLGGINPFFILYLLRSQENIIAGRGTGTTFNAITGNKLKGIKITLPPLAEQKRIVTKIEELFSLIENAKNILRNVKLQIPKLLQKTIDDFTMDGIKNSQIHRLGEIADIRGGVTLGRQLKEKTVKMPYLRVANVQDGYLDLSEIKEIEVLESEREKWLLKSGDILLTEGGDRDKLGRGTVWRGQISTCIHQNHIFRVRLDKRQFDPDFISLILRSSRSKNFFQNAGKQTVNLASINKTQLSSFEFSCPDITTQRLLLTKILQSVDYLNELKKASNDIEKKLSILENQILYYAFQGKLASQDPNDEPAEVLLQKIRQEKLQEIQKVNKAKSFKSRRIKNAK